MRRICTSCLMRILALNVFENISESLALWWPIFHNARMTSIDEFSNNKCWKHNIHIWVFLSSYRQQFCGVMNPVQNISFTLWYNRQIITQKTTCIHFYHNQYSFQQGIICRHFQYLYIDKASRILNHILTDVMNRKCIFEWSCTG